MGDMRDMGNSQFSILNSQLNFQLSTFNFLATLFNVGTIFVELFDKPNGLIDMLKMMLLAGCGGFVGTALRFLTGKICGYIKLGDFPLGTFVVNVVGSLLIGILFGLAEQRGALSPSASAVLITGFCGGFTTFSTFADDIFLLLQKGQWLIFATYVALSLVVGVLLVWAGRSLVR